MNKPISEHATDALKFGCGLILVVLILILAQCAILISEIPDDMCGSTLGFEEFASDKSIKSVVYDFNCGAMDSFSTNISILGPKATLPSEGGNIFTSKGGERRGDWGGPYVETQWLNPKHLHIRYVKDATVFTKLDSMGDIKITYEQL